MVSKSSSVKLNTDSCILGFTKKSLSAVLGLEMSFSSSKRWILFAPSAFNLLFGRSGFNFFQNSTGNDVVEASSIQKSLTAFLFSAVTLFPCCCFFFVVSPV